MNKIYFAWLLFATYTSTACQEKVLICGVCKDTEKSVPFTIESIEALGAHFADYAVIIYENNSADNTPCLYREWAEKNSRVHFTSEIIRQDQLETSRTEIIAKARNNVLSLAKDPQYDDFKYLIMADLDFSKVLWPIEEILEALELPEEWDCICANGINSNQEFLDLYSFRDSHFPFGAEMLGDKIWWKHLDEKRSKIGGDTLLPVYSAFGGLAIYKRDTIIRFSYSGIVTENLREHYQNILRSIPQKHPQLQEYLHLLNLPEDSDLSTVPIVFQNNTTWEHEGYPLLQTCCEHVPLHASMTIHGFGKIFIYPKMKMYY